MQRLFLPIMFGSGCLGNYCSWEQNREVSSFNLSHSGCTFLTRLAFFFFPGILPVSLNERTNKPYSNIFFIWFSMNVNILSYEGGSLLQAPSCLLNNCFLSGSLLGHQALWYSDQDFATHASPFFSLTCSVVHSHLTCQFQTREAVVRLIFYSNYDYDQRDLGTQARNATNNSISICLWVTYFANSTPAFILLTSPPPPNPKILRSHLDLCSGFNGLDRICNFELHCGRTVAGKCR